MIRDMQRSSVQCREEEKRSGEDDAAGKVCLQWHCVSIFLLLCCSVVVFVFLFFWVLVRVCVMTRRYCSSFRSLG